MLCWYSIILQLFVFTSKLNNINHSRAQAFLPVKSCWVFFCNFTTYRHYLLCINEKLTNFINIQTIRKHWNLTSKIFVKTSTFRIQKSDHYISNKYEIYLRNDLRTKLVPFKISITTFTRYLFKQFFFFNAYNHKLL